MTTTPAPHIVAFNLTRRCNLACAHCYLDAEQRATGPNDDMSTDEVKTALTDLAAMGEGIMVVLTGGEPLLRPDLDQLAAHASDAGLMVVVGTNGLGLTRERAQRLKSAGVAGVGISLDSLEPEHHDKFRGLNGAWARTMTAFDACRAVGLPFQIHFSVTDDNAGELDDLIAFGRSVGAMALNCFFLVCTGRGETVTNISREIYEKTLARITVAARDESQRADGPGMMIRAKCAPHFKRMAMTLDPSWPITTAHGYEAGGCLAGVSYFRVTPQGGVTACPYMETEVGSLKDTPMAQLWREAPMFKALRNPVLEGRCGACEYAKLCGGCRARPLAKSGALMGEDFLCAYEPQGGAVIEPLHPVNGPALSWTAEAETRLTRVPSFVRAMVRRRAEDHVRTDGRHQVTADDLHKLAKLRFAKGLPPGISRPDFAGENVDDG